MRIQSLYEHIFGNSKPYKNPGSQNNSSIFHQNKMVINRMGVGKISSKPGIVKGLDIGLDFMGGCSFIPPEGSRKEACSG